MAAAREEKTKELNLSKKGLTSVDVGKYTTLQKVDLSKNKLKNADELKRFNTLRWLNLSNNCFTSVIFAKKMKSLVVLNVGSNQLTDLGPLEGLNGPVELAVSVQRAELKALILNNNQISDTLPIQGLTSLNTLVLSNNNIEEIDVRALNGLNKLQLSHNKLKAFPNIKFNADLKNLSLNDNNIQSVPEECVETSRLDNLDLGKNKIVKFKCIVALQKISRLRQLNLKGNAVTEVDHYSDKVCKMLPWMRTLDTQPVDSATSGDDTETKASMTDKKKRTLEEEPQGGDSKKVKKKKTKEVEVEEDEDQPLSESSESTQTPKKKKKKKKPAAADTEAVTSSESLDTKDIKQKVIKGVHALKETASGVVAIHDVRKKQKKISKTKDIFSAFKTDIGTGTSSSW